MDKAFTSKPTLFFFFSIQFLCKIAAKLLFSLEVIGSKNIPNDGACILACNHISFVDWLLLSSVSPRPIRFVLYFGYYTKSLQWFMNLAQVIPIASKAENKEIYYSAFDTISDHLNYNRLVCIFPEGKITTTGEMDTFKHGIEKILKRNLVPIVPAKLSYTLWGHWSTRSRDKFSPFKRPKVRLVISNVIDSEYITANALETIIRNIDND